LRRKEKKSLSLVERKGEKHENALHKRTLVIAENPSFAMMGTMNIKSQGKKKAKWR